MKKKILFPILIVVVVMSGCMVGPNFRKPEYNGPEDFRFAETSDSTINLRWWEIFDDPVLDTLIKTAIDENKDVLIAAARIEAARANIGFTKADGKPSIGYGSGISISGFNDNVSSEFYAIPELSWELDFWGKYRRMDEAAQANLLATEYGKRTVQMGLISAVATTYFNILAVNDQLQIATHTVASRDSGYNLLQSRYEGGLIALIDLNQAQIQRDIAATVVPTYKRIIALNENALSILLGQMPRDIEKGIPFYQQKYELDIPVGIPSDILERRPDIKLAEELYRAKNAQIGIAEALRWPSFNLTSTFGLASADLLNLNAYGLSWSAGIAVLGPLFQFGKNKRRVEIAEANARASLIEYEQTVLQAFKEVEDALISIETYKEELIAQQSRTKTAMESENLAYVRYDEGSTTYLEVLEMQRQSFGAQLDLLSNRLNLLNSYIRLYKALGGGWLSPEEEQQYMEEQSSNAGSGDGQ